MAGIYAQPGHYFHFDVGGGVQPAIVSGADNTMSSGAGYNGTLNFAYQCFLHYNWGIGIGAGFSAQQSNIKVSGMQSAMEYDADNALDYEYRVYYSNWSEQRQLCTVDIPVAVYYKKEGRGLWGFQMSAGPKLHIPVMSSYKAAGTIETRAYYPTLNVEIKDLPDHDFQSQHLNYNGKSNVSIYPSVFLEVGANRNLPNMGGYGTNLVGDLYFGAYIDCGFIPNSGDATMLYDVHRNYATVLGMESVDMLIPVSIGLKVGITLTSEKRNMMWIWW